MGRYHLAAILVLCQPLIMPAHGCSSASACGGIVDGFFLGLIAGPVENSDTAAAPPSRPVMPAVSPLPPGGGPIVIAPPASDAALPAAMPASGPDPTRPHILKQGLVTGRIIDGGEAWMSFFESAGESETRVVVASPLVKLSSFGGAEEWQRVHRVELAVFPAWPAETVSQPVAMLVGCGACADGAPAEMTGTGILDFSLAGTDTPSPNTAAAGISRIRDISLQASAGPAATGEMQFILRTADGPIATADEARMQLDFGDYSTDLRLRLLVWLHADGRAGGAFTGMAENPDADPGADPGAVVGYFSGASCAPACGVEN
ncbi:MAG: hypothetical protein VYA42_03150 [Pseudomonadota bacterium]|nr:hypothetical protein [Pseudomonadota bacterium]